MRLVPVPLRDLVLTQEFMTPHRRRSGSVVATGWYPWDDGTGREVRLRAVLVRYEQDGSERIHTAEMLVLVPENTPHCRFTGTEWAQRWSQRLRDPDSVGTVGEVAKAAKSAPAGPRGSWRAPC